MITGATAQGFEHLLLDSGALIENFKAKYDTITTFNALIDAYLTALYTTDCLGLSRGGNHFISEGEPRQVEFDGSRVRFKGDFVKDAAHPRIETTLLEFTPENLKRIIPASDITSAGAKTVLRERLRIKDADYMKSLTWIRELKNGSISLFTLFNPMNTANVDITGPDKNEGEMSVVFEGFNDNFQDLEYAPYEILIFNP